jgi:hypothetical protein
METKNLEYPAPWSNDTETLSRSPTEPDLVNAQNEGGEARPMRGAVPKNTISNVISRTYSRVTNRDVIDPGPAPDGGFKAWTQVSMAFLVCLTTWGE